LAHEVEELTVDYLCERSGGPVLYLGQDMKTAHAGLRINASEWDMAMDHVQRAISKLKVSETAGKELLDLWAATKRQSYDEKPRSGIARFARQKSSGGSRRQDMNQMTEWALLMN